MRIMSKLSVAAVFGLWLAGCGGPDLGDEDVVSRIERDFGGPDGVMEFFESHTEDEIRQVMALYGVGFKRHKEDELQRALESYGEGDVTAALITDCPQYFPSSDRSTWHNINGEYYFIESAGRPYRAYAYLPPIAAAERDETCQGKVGQWGDAANPSNDYDGGHLIGSQLGGWGRRANLVPQDANFNRGNWATLENKMAKCGSLPNGRLRYYIGANYPNSTTLIPNTMKMEIKNRSTGASVLLSFENTDYGGSNGTNEKNRGVAFLTDQGCN